MKELVENLTQNKLDDANKISELQKKMTRFNEMEVENEAIKRQLKRLNDENESLLDQLKDVEDKESFESKIQALMLKLEEKEKENKVLQDIVEKNSSKIKSLINSNSNLKDCLTSRDAELTEDQMKFKYSKCIEKLKIYREKIFEISEKLNHLKIDRETLLKTTKDYSQHVSKWQVEIASASLKMTERIHESNKQLRQKQAECDELKQKLLLHDNESNENILKEMKLENENLKEKLSMKEKELIEEKDALKKLKNVTKKPSVLDLEIEAYEKTLDELNKKLEAKKLQEKEFESTVQIQLETIDSLKSQVGIEDNLRG